MQDGTKSEKAPGEKVICLYPGCENEAVEPAAQERGTRRARVRPRATARTRTHNAASHVPGAEDASSRRPPPADAEPPARRGRGRQLQRVPMCTKRSAGTPPPRASIARVASGIVTKRRSASAAGVRSSLRRRADVPQAGDRRARARRARRASRARARRAPCARSRASRRGPRRPARAPRRSSDTPACAAARSTGARGRRPCRSSARSRTGPAATACSTSAAGASPLRRRQRVAGRRDDDQPVAQERLGHHRRHVLAIGHGRAERDVDACGWRAARRTPRAARPAGRPRCRRWRRLKTLSSGPAANSANGGVAATRSVVRLAVRVADRVAGPRRRDRGCRSPRCASRRPPGRQLDDPAGADVELVAELLAQGSDRAGYRRLRDLQRARRRLDGAEPGDRHEGAKLRKGRLSDRFMWVAARS